MKLFEAARIGTVRVQNRIVRSATFEGMADQDGYPTANYQELYEGLARNHIGAIITGFMFVSQEGRAMHPGQAGLEGPAKVEAFRRITEKVHQQGGAIFAQLAHTGRQTKAAAIKAKVRGVSNKASFYFREIPRPFSTGEVYAVIDQFADAAKYAKEADFDGIQLHAAHGYLIHQFLSPSVNNRKDLFGIDPQSGLGTKFLELIIDKIRKKCGQDYPILVKVSGSDDGWPQRSSEAQFIKLIQFLEKQNVAAIEISYGTMDYALNIFRGDIPVDLVLKVNPVYRVQNPLLKKVWKMSVLPLLKLKIKPFTPCYNWQYAQIAKANTKIPIIFVGGIRQGSEMINLVEDAKVDFVSLCRPFLAEPDLVKQLKANLDWKSKCINCNFCSIMCDSKYPTRCYQMKENN